MTNYRGRLRTATRYVVRGKRTTKSARWTANFPRPHSSKECFTFALREAPWACCGSRFWHKTFLNWWQARGLERRGKSQAAEYLYANLGRMRLRYRRLV